MKIDGFQAQNLYESYNAKTAGQKSDDASTAAQNAAASDSADTLTLSDEAASLKHASTTAQQLLGGDTGEDREARIRELQNQIQSGQYSIPSRDVAASILKGSFFNAKA